MVSSSLVSCVAEAIEILNLLHNNFNFELNSNNIAVENGQKYNSDYNASYVIDGNKTNITNTHIPETISKTSM